MARTPATPQARMKKMAERAAQRRQRERKDRRSPSARPRPLRRRLLRRPARYRATEEAHRQDRPPGPVARHAVGQAASRARSQPQPRAVEARLLLAHPGRCADRRGTRVGRRQGDPQRRTARRSRSRPYRRRRQAGGRRTQGLSDGQQAARAGHHPRRPAETAARSTTVWTASTCPSCLRWGGSTRRAKVFC